MIAPPSSVCRCVKNRVTRKLEVSGTPSSAYISGAQFVEYTTSAVSLVSDKVELFFSD